MDFLAANLATLESSIPDPRRGLPEEVFPFVSRSTLLINVDLLIQDDHGHTLPTWRDDPSLRETPASLAQAD